MTITVIIVIITCVVSFMAFSNQKLKSDLIFYPPAIANNKQWYRFFTSGLIHDNIGHLLFNMVSLYSFGRFVEQGFADIFGDKGVLLYALLYITALAASDIPTYSREKNNYHYAALGASGAVSAVVFVGIMLSPIQKIGFIFFPIGIPGFIFGALFLVISAYLAKQGQSRIGHSA